MRVNGLCRMCSIFIQGSQNISCSSPSILIILTHQQTKLDSRIQLQKKRSVTLKLCVPFSHSDVNHSTFSFQNENSSFQMIKIGACVYLKIKPKSTKEKRELQLMCCLSFQTSFLCIYTPIVVDVNTQSYANRIIFCLPSSFVSFYFSSPKARAYLLKSFSGEQLLCKAK